MHKEYLFSFKNNVKNNSLFKNKLLVINLQANKTSKNSRALINCGHYWLLIESRFKQTNKQNLYGEKQISLCVPCRKGPLGIFFFFVVVVGFFFLHILLFSRKHISMLNIIYWLIFKVYNNIIIKLYLKYTNLLLTFSFYLKFILSLVKKFKHYLLNLFNSSFLHIYVEECFLQCNTYICFPYLIFLLLW